MTSTEDIVKFVTFLAQTQRMFLQVQIFAENSALLHSVSTSIFPTQGKSSDYAEYGVTISVALHAMLRRPPDSEKWAMGMSLLLRHTGGSWLAEAEVGWTGQEIGWDPFDSKEVRATSIDEIYLNVPPLVEWMGLRFRDEVARLPS